MPEILPGDLFARAIGLVDTHICQLGNARRLTADELEHYKARSAVVGWRIHVGFAGESNQNLDILADSDFPCSRPLIAVSRDYFMHWPHVELDGIVCSFSESATHNPYDPISVVDRLLGETATLIDECSQGLRIDDFRSEFLSYWNRTVDNSAPHVFSLLSRFCGNRIIVVWRGSNHYLVADTATQAENWLSRRYSASKTDFSLEDALMLDLPAPMLPDEYPVSSSDLLRLIRERCPDAMHLLASLVLRDAKHLIVIMAAPSQNGPALAGLRVSPPVASNILGRQSEVMNRGFRPGNVPKHLLVTRYFGPESHLEHLAIDRADAAWIHGRARDERTSQLNRAKVVVFGIGSVGGFIAEHLASAGVGNLTLVDPEVLTFANAGRHILGANSHGKPKALEVAALLQVRFPHHEIKGFCTSAQTFLKENEATIANMDLIVCVTGDWATDVLINERYVHSALPRVLFGWTEPHAVAGHGVLLSDRTCCLRCHFDDAGECELRVSQWDEETQLQEPACGGVFQPYGPVELAMINAMISSVALEALGGELAGSVHRIYTTDQATVGKLGGEFTNKGCDLIADISDQQRITKTLRWAPNPNCRCCGGGALC